MTFSRIMAILLSVVLAGFGLIFLIAAVSGNAGMRLLIAAVLMGAAAFLLVFALKRPAGGPVPGTTIEQKVELSGNVRRAMSTKLRRGIQGLRQPCRRRRSSSALIVAEPIIEEEPKW
jgi:hypothetical protein